MYIQAQQTCHSLMYESGNKKVTAKKTSSGFKPQTTRKFQNNAFKSLQNMWVSNMKNDLLSTLLSQ